MKTFVATDKNVDKKWYLVDAEGKTLGRLASEVAKILMGKNKPQFSPSTDTGDYVIVINAAKIKVTGKKTHQKMYRHHTGYPGGLKEVRYSDMMNRKPERIFEMAVKGMLPKNTLGRQMYRKLHVYAEGKHEQAAQQPEILNIEA